MKKLYSFINQFLIHIQNAFFNIFWPWVNCRNGTHLCNSWHFIIALQYCFVLSLKTAYCFPYEHITYITSFYCPHEPQLSYHITYKIILCIRVTKRMFFLISAQSNDITSKGCAGFSRGPSSNTPSSDWPSSSITWSTTTPCSCSTNFNWSCYVITVINQNNNKPNMLL